MARDRMQRQRFEQKYMLGEDEVPAIREFVSNHLELDENGVGKPDYSYPVHSLYLDSPELTTFWTTINGDKNRYKLRLRFYNDHPDSPVFFEIKRRMNNCILKQRGGVRKEAVPWLMRGQLPDSRDLLKPEGKNLLAIQRFVELATKIHAVPQAHVCYQREAYVDPVSDSVRVTLDRNVFTEVRTEATFGTAMRDPSRPFGNRVILELKFTDRFPDWLRQMFERLGLMQCGAAKYCEGLAGLPGMKLSHAGDFREAPARKGIFVEDPRNIAAGYL